MSERASATLRKNSLTLASATAFISHPLLPEPGLRLDLGDDSQHLHERNPHALVEQAWRLRQQRPVGRLTAE